MTLLVLLIMLGMGALAIACALRATPDERLTDPNTLAPHDAIDADDPELPYGWSGP